MVLAGSLWLCPPHPQLDQPTHRANGSFSGSYSCLPPHPVDILDIYNNTVYRIYIREGALILIPWWSMSVCKGTYVNYSINRNVSFFLLMRGKKSFRQLIKTMSHGLPLFIRFWVWVSVSQKGKTVLTIEKNLQFVLHIVQCRNYFNFSS